MASQRRVSSRYKTGRLLGRIISFLGWIVVAAAVIFAILFAIGLTTRGEFADQMMILGMAGLAVGSILAGIFLVAVGQMLRATLDTADNTRQMLDIMQA
jgi:hypothetical protein